MALGIDLDVVDSMIKSLFIQFKPLKIVINDIRLIVKNNLKK